MPRKLRVENLGAVYIIPSPRLPPPPWLRWTRRREDIHLNDADRQDFLKTLAEACLKTGWQVHAYCLIKPEMLEKMEGQLGDHHSGTLRLESDPGKLTLAARLRHLNIIPSNQYSNTYIRPTSIFGITSRMLGTTSLFFCKR